jgi:hypothetical protein
MERSRHAPAAAGALAALWCLAGPAALAGAQAPAAPPAPDPRKALGQVIDTRDAGNVAAEKSQQRIEEISDETESLIGQYRTALKQIDSLDRYNAQMRDLIAAQQQELASLQDQLDRVEIVGRSMTPLMFLMIDSLEKFVSLDLPFLPEEREKRIAELRGLMARPDVTTAERFRQIMEAYQIENEYGRTIEAYRAPLRRDGKEITVDYLRFGRIALVYQTLDAEETGVWNRETGAWEVLPAGDRSAIRQGLKIARKQSAPDLITVPLPPATAPRGES